MYVEERHAQGDISPKVKMILPNIYGVIYVVKSKVAFQIKTVETKLQILQFLKMVSVRSVDEIKPVSHF